ncbi:hypothetical protein [Streptosporangium sp. NPDC049644]|uniref:hypothetical protein n=1 Tax=Streptosporangium sp. NPDC049644 TaxID=3155507 RepID=UPI00343DB4BE
MTFVVRQGNDHARGASCTVAARHGEEIVRLRRRAAVPRVHPYTHQAWRGRMRTCGVGASLTDTEVAAFDADPARPLRELLPEEPRTVPSRISAFVARRRNRSARSCCDSRPKALLAAVPNTGGGASAPPMPHFLL